MNLRNISIGKRIYSIVGVFTLFGLLLTLAFSVLVGKIEEISKEEEIQVQAPIKNNIQPKYIEKPQEIKKQEAINQNNKI